MRILILGDVVGEPGRRLVEAHVPALRRELALDFVVVNGENAAHGNGITDRIAREWLDELGVDVITTGNHAFDVKDVGPCFQKEPQPAAAGQLSLPGLRATATSSCTPPGAWRSWSST
jgi:calcineurin-like phosphoesterase